MMGKTVKNLVSFVRTKANQVLHKAQVNKVLSRKSALIGFAWSGLGFKPFKYPGTEHSKL